MLLRRVLFFCGFAAPLLLIAAVAIGGALIPGYSHLSMSVGALIELGAAYSTLIAVLFLASGALLLVFAWAEGMSIRGEDLKVMTAGCFAMGAVGLLGIVATLLFPSYPAGALTALPGIVHLAFSIALAAAAILSVAFLGVGSKVRDAFWYFSLVDGLLLLAAVVVAFLFSFRSDPLSGLMERIALGIFLAWVFMLAIGLLTEDSGRSRR